MKTFARWMTPFILLAALLTPMQAALAWQGTPPPPGASNVFIGSSYTLKAGETLNDSLVVVGGSATLEEGAVVKGDVVVVGGSAFLANKVEVNGNVVVVGGALQANAVVKGDAVVVGGPATLQEKAHVRGNMVAIGGMVEKKDGARVDGDSVQKDTLTLPELSTAPALPNLPDGFGLAWDGARVFFNALLLAGLAALLAVFLPAQLRRAADTVISQPFMAGGMGILTWLAFVVTVVALALFSILLITLLLTVPLLLVVLLVMTAASLFGWVALGTETGIRLLGASNTNWPLPASAALGTFLLTLVADGIGMIACVGWVAPAIVALLGLGAAVMTRFGSRNILAPTAFVTTAESGLPRQE